VKAREGTWRYLAGRFAIRHKLPLAMAAAVWYPPRGLVMTERERQVAVAERRAPSGIREREEARQRVRVDVHGEIEHLPGSLKARQTLVAPALQYLDRLAGESRGDSELALEVANAYRKLAEISGDSRGAHLEIRSARGAMRTRRDVARGRRGARAGQHQCPAGAPRTGAAHRTPETRSGRRYRGE